MVESSAGIFVMQNLFTIDMNVKLAWFCENAVINAIMVGRCRWLTTQQLSGFTIAMGCPCQQIMDDKGLYCTVAEFVCQGHEWWIADVTAVPVGMHRYGKEF